MEAKALLQPTPGFAHRPIKIATVSRGCVYRCGQSIITTCHFSHCIVMSLFSVFAGKTALSSFRLEKLRTAVKAVAPDVQIEMARHWYFIALKSALSDADSKRLHDLLDLDAANANQDTEGMHRILVVPSRWREPFGLVALEGIACGCVAVVSADGGLIDAAGPCGRSVPNGDVPALARCLRELLTEPTQIAYLRAGADVHLARHASSAVAQRYLEIIADAAASRSEPTTAGAQS